MCNLFVQVFRRILRTSISLSMIVRSAVHLSGRRSRRPMSSTYSREISYRTLRSWVRWALTRVLGPLVPSTMLRARHRMTLLVRSPECPRRKHRRRQDTSALAVKFGRETHTVHLSFRGCFVGVDVFLFKQFFIWLLFIYLLLFSHLWFQNYVFLIYVFTLTSYKIFI
jgi:hypothetical protein